MNPWRILIGVAIGLALFLGGYGKGFVDAKRKYEVQELKTVVKEIKKNEKIKKDVVLAPVDDLKRRYCKWVRDGEQECLDNPDIPLRLRPSDRGNDGTDRRL